MANETYNTKAADSRFSPNSSVNANRGNASNPPMA